MGLREVQMEIRQRLNNIRDEINEINNIDIRFKEARKVLGKTPTLASEIKYKRMYKDYINYYLDKVEQLGGFRESIPHFRMLESGFVLFSEWKDEIQRLVSAKDKFLSWYLSIFGFFIALASIVVSVFI